LGFGLGTFDSGLRSHITLSVTNESSAAEKCYDDHLSY